MNIPCIEESYPGAELGYIAEAFHPTCGGWQTVNSDMFDITDMISQGYEVFSIAIWQDTVNGVPLFLFPDFRADDLRAEYEDFSYTVYAMSMMAGSYSYQ